jgi:hypothetical protein
MTKLHFEFVSTHRNRNMWPNPCLFEVPWSGNGQSAGLNAYDPLSTQVPIVTFSGQPILINATVVSQTTGCIVVSAPANSFSWVQDYYHGAELSFPPSIRINSSRFLSQSGGLDYMQFAVVADGVQPHVADPVTVQCTPVPNTLFVPSGSDASNAYVGCYLYNDTQGQFVTITDYDTVYHKVIATIPGGWLPSDQYSIRAQLPTVGHFPLAAPSTTYTLNLNGIAVSPGLGDFIRVVSTNEIVKVVSFDPATRIATVAPLLDAPLAFGEIVELLSQTSDNYKTLSYNGTSVGQHEQVSYDVSLVSGTVPNVPILNGMGGFPSDYPFLYVELYDTNHPAQNTLFSNNHSNKSYFKVTTPTGQLINREEKFTKYTGDLSHKTIRFRPTSNFRIAWRLPSGETIRFAINDTRSPYPPNQMLQTSVLFNIKRE